ncbi:MAG: hypothetical protein PVH36_14935 [Desulfobacterales bacterium]
MTQHVEEKKKYMVLFVDVKDGIVDYVYESNKLGTIGGEAKEIKTPFNIDSFTSDRAIGTFCTKSNPT